MRNKAAIITAVAGILLLLSGTGLTIGYLNTRESVVNVFTVGELKLGLEESDWEPNKGDGKNVCPGYCVYKNPTVKNLTRNEPGQQPCYVRMSISICDEKGEKITDEQALNLIRSTIHFDDTYNGTYEKQGQGEKIVEGKLPGYSLEELEKLPMINPLFQIDEERSSKNVIVCNYVGADNKGLFPVGAEAALFTAIAIPTHWTAADMEKVGDFQLLLSAEAIQSAGFSDSKAAFSALDAETEGRNQV